jgi:hypothetical protein
LTLSFDTASVIAKIEPTIIGAPTIINKAISLDLVSGDLGKFIKEELPPYANFANDFIVHLYIKKAEIKPSPKLISTCLLISSINGNKFSLPLIINSFTVISPASPKCLA